MSRSGDARTPAATGCWRASACWSCCSRWPRLSVLIYDVLHDGLGRLSWEFLTSYPSRRAEAGRHLCRR